MADPGADAPFVSIGLYVAAVEADCRRAEEAEPLRIGWRLHLNESHLRLDPEVGGNTLDKFACTQIVRTALEVRISADGALTPSRIAAKARAGSQP